MSGIIKKTEVIESGPIEKNKSSWKNFINKIIILLIGLSFTTKLLAQAASGTLGYSTSESIIALLIIFLLVILPIILCVKRAKKLNRSTVFWGFLGFFFSYIAVIVVFLESKKEKKVNISMKKCPYCGEEILAAAKKCKYCDEWLEEKDKK